MKISVITVTFNSESVIQDCLSSVMMQKYKNIEHIIIDGKSNDGTLSILESQRNHFAALISEPDKGIYDAMNKGIKIATGDIIGFLNSDDFYVDKNVLSKVANIFTDNPSIEACYSDLIYVDQLTASKTVRYIKSSKFKSGLFLKGWCPPHPTFFVRRSNFERYGNFNLDYKIASDVDLMIRFLEVKKIQCLYVPEIWVKMRMGGTTNKNLKNIFLQNYEIILSLKKYNLPVNLINFFINKIISRIKQYLKKVNI